MGMLQRGAGARLAAGSRGARGLARLQALQGGGGRYGHRLQGRLREIRLHARRLTAHCAALL